MHFLTENLIISCRK